MIYIRIKMIKFMLVFIFEWEKNTFWWNDPF